MMVVRPAHDKAEMWQGLLERCGQICNITPAALSRRFAHGSGLSACLLACVPARLSVYLIMRARARFL